MKLSKIDTIIAKARSLPVRECGLKHVRSVGHNADIAVTPRAGVWIETVTKQLPLRQTDVTPRAGVWIETTGIT